MDAPQTYLVSFWGIATIIFLIFLQWSVATIAKASQPGAVPGKISDDLSHDAFVFRAHRTFMNTLENIPAMFACCFLAIWIGADAFYTALFIWAFVLGRVIHMGLYYQIATEKNPSPRSYFFMLGLLANLALFGLCLMTLSTL